MLKNSHIKKIRKWGQFRWITKKSLQESNQIYNFVPNLMTVRDRYNVHQTELARTLFVITSTKLKEKNFWSV